MEQWKARLPAADDALIAEMLLASRRPFKQLDVSTLKVGDIVRLTTVSGNRYLIEIINPNERKAHMYRHEGRGKAESGYRGERLLTDKVVVGRSMTYYRVNGSHIHRTSAVASIVLL